MCSPSSRLAYAGWCKFQLIHSLLTRVHGDRGLAFQPSPLNCHVHDDVLPRRVWNCNLYRDCRVSCTRDFKGPLWWRGRGLDLNWVPKPVWRGLVDLMRAWGRGRRWSTHWRALRHVIVIVTVWIWRPKSLTAAIRYCTKFLLKYLWLSLTL